MIPLLAAAVGLIAGIHTATWGMYKDAPHEGFSGRKYARSIVLATVIAVVIAGGWDSIRGEPPTWWCCSAPPTRSSAPLAEVYKTFLREEDQSKYFIPMQFSVFGQVVRSRSARLLAGAGYVAACLGVLILVIAIERASPNPTPLGTRARDRRPGRLDQRLRRRLEGRAQGGIPDPQVLPQPVHRHRVRAAPLPAHRRPGAERARGRSGFTIATTETYKTFFFPSKPRGKFAGMPVLHPDMLRKRQPFIALYAAIWLVVIVAWIAAAR